MYLTSLSPLHNAAIKDMASNLERRWRNMISDVEGSSKAPESKGNEGRSCRFDFLLQTLNLAYLACRFKIQETETQ